MKEKDPNDQTKLPSLLHVVESDKKSMKAVKSIAKAMNKLGLIGIDRNKLRQFQEIGVNIEPEAFIQNGRAGAMVGQQVAVRVLTDLNRIFSDASDKGKTRMIPHIACMIRALASANKNVKDLSIAGQELKPKKPSQHLHYHSMVPSHVANMEATEVVVEPNGNPVADGS